MFLMSALCSNILVDLSRVHQTSFFSCLKYLPFLIAIVSEIEIVDSWHFRRTCEVISVLGSALFYPLKSVSARSSFSFKIIR